jgi:hypothetical protein
MIKSIVLNLGMVVHTCYPSIKRLRLEDQEFEALL